MLPDLLGPGVLKIAKVEIDGVEKELKPEAASHFRIPLEQNDLGRQIRIYLCQSDENFKSRSRFAIEDKTFK